MKKFRHSFILPLFLFILFLVAGCSQQPAISTPEASKDAELKPGDSPDVISLQIIAVDFDSSDPDGPITVRWEAEGDFSEGFMMAWDTDNPAPLPGQHGWVFIDDSEAREVDIDLTEKVPQYFRICRVKNGVCDVFSDTIQVVFP